MNRETVHSVKEKSMYRNALQLNTDVKERTNEEGLMNHRKGGRKKKRKKESAQNVDPGEENSPAAPVGTRTRHLLITSPAL